LSQRFVGGQIVIDFTAAGYDCHMTYHVGGREDKGPSGAFHIKFEKSTTGEYYAIRFLPQIATNHRGQRFIIFSHINYVPSDNYVFSGLHKPLPGDLQRVANKVLQIINEVPLPLLSDDELRRRQAQRAQATVMSASKLEADARNNSTIKNRFRNGENLGANLIEAKERVQRVISSAYCSAGVPVKGFSDNLKMHYPALARFWANDHTSEELSDYWNSLVNPSPADLAEGPCCGGAGAPSCIIDMPTPHGSPRGPREGGPASDPRPGSGLSAMVPSSVVYTPASRKKPTVYFTNNGYSTTPLNNNGPIPPGSARSDPASVGLPSVVVQTAIELPKNAGYGSTSGTASALLKELENGNESPENKYQPRGLGKKRTKSKKSKKENNSTTNSTEKGYNANNDLFNYNGGGGKRRRTRRT
jgi:hypothetical protein